MEEQTVGVPRVTQGFEGGRDVNSLAVGGPIVWGKERKCDE